MNSLDKMEDYDRLKQERDELAAHNNVLFEALRLEDANNFACGIKSEQTTVNALHITPSAALREIEARVLEGLLDDLTVHVVVNETDSRKWVELIDIENVLLAAKRGE